MIEEQPLLKVETITKKIMDQIRTVKASSWEGRDLITGILKNIVMADPPIKLIGWVQVEGFNIKVLVRKTAENRAPEWFTIETANLPGYWGESVVKISEQIFLT